MTRGLCECVALNSFTHAVLNTAMGDARLLQPLQSINLVRSSCEEVLFLFFFIYPPPGRAKNSWPRAARIQEFVMGGGGGVRFSTGTVMYTKLFQWGGGGGGGQSAWGYILKLGGGGGGGGGGGRVGKLNEQ